MADWIDQLKRLGELLKDGFITEEEFELAKKKLLRTSIINSDVYSPFSFEHLFPEMSYRLDYSELELLALSNEDIGNLLDMWGLGAIKGSIPQGKWKGNQKIITEILSQQGWYRKTGREYLYDESLRAKKI